MKMFKSFLSIIGCFLCLQTAWGTSLRISEQNEQNTGCDLYSARFESKQSFLDFYRHLLKALEEKNVVKLGSLSLYPLNTKLDGKKVQLKDEVEFQKHFKSFFTNDVIEGAQRQKLSEVFCSPKGVQIGNAGQLWIQIDENKKIGIRTINP